ncbi:hypothetical protein PGT21_013365 [Puccinia graminis f. sp. tritici]|uniref:Uncharacterized protein n=1 Tax=Puccinia graminis f. sp. tritici TaxID=56615 RepID=A0A5B0SKZ3_PUCGR|nr:hypothetical protein PGT21_013365 [Puccinia graminis f. sp. tritici]KAA1138598.1 hypothetical protein PGTUg99_030665 [Puccinia graminis f. sp. tritici]
MDLLRLANSSPQAGSLGIATSHAHMAMTLTGIARPCIVIRISREVSETDGGTSDLRE